MGRNFDLPPKLMGSGTAISCGVSVVTPTTGRSIVFGARSQKFFRPWWRPAVGWLGVTVVVALAYTYLPEMQRGRMFLQELRYTAIMATIIIVGMIVANAALDSWDQVRSKRRGAGRIDPEQESP